MRRRHSPPVIAFLSVCALTAAVAGGIPAAGASPPGTVSGATGSPDMDARVGRVAPSAVQLTAAAGQNLSISWNALGTPRSMFHVGGYLATGLSSDAVTAARQYIHQQRDLLGLAPGAEQQLQLIMDA